MVGIHILRSTTKIALPLPISCFLSILQIGKEASQNYATYWLFSKFVASYLKKGLKIQSPFEQFVITYHCLYKLCDVFSSHQLDVVKCIASLLCYNKLAFYKNPCGSCISLYDPLQNIE